MRLFKRFTAVNSLAAILLLVIFAYLSYERFHAAEIREKDANLERCLRTFAELLKHKGEGFNLRDGKLLAGSYVINGNFEVPDKVREIFGGTATVFMRDLRVSTNVVREDGKRAVGTRLEGAAYDAIFRQGTAFRGETNILGIPYFTAYDPIRDSNGNIIGALYVGLKKSEFLAQHTLLKTQIVLILLGLLAVFITFMILFSRLVKKAERTIEADHQFLQTLIDTIPTPVFYKDVHGSYLGGNKAFEAYSGLPSKQLIGKTCFELLPPDLADHVYKCEQELLQHQGLLVEEAAMPCADGTLREVIYYKTTFPAADGSIGGLIGTMLDISERKRAEVELRESQADLKHAQAVARTGSWRLNVVRNELNWSDETRRMFDISKGTPLTYEVFLSIVHPDDRGAVDRAWQAALKGAPYDIEHRIVVQDAVRWVRERAELEFDRDGALLGAFGAVQDVTERKEMEEELRISRQMLEDVTQGIMESILLLSRDFKIVWANRTAITQAALPLEKIVGKDCYAVTHHRQSPCDSPDEPCPLREFKSSGQSQTVQHSHYDQDGNQFVAEVNVYPVKDSAGETTGFIHVSRDITERARMKKEIADKVMQLEATLAKVQQLEGILPICMYCKKIRDDTEIWRQMEEYISKHSQANFSHGICPDCYQRQLDEFKAMRKE